VDQLKAAVKKQDATIKAKQKEFQTLQLESEQLASDLTSAQEQLEEASTSTNSIVKEVEDLAQQHKRQKVCLFISRLIVRNCMRIFRRRWTANELGSPTLMKSCKPSTPSSARRIQSAQKALSHSKNCVTKSRNTTKRNKLPLQA